MTSHKLAKFLMIQPDVEVTIESSEKEYEPDKIRSITVKDNVIILYSAVYQGDLPVDLLEPML